MILTNHDDEFSEKTVAKILQNMMNVRFVRGSDSECLNLL